MTTNITAQQCKQELENILMDAVENGNFNYKIEVSKKNYYDKHHEEYTRGVSEFKSVKVVIKENETKEIFVDTDYTALNSEDIRIAEVRLEELLSWDKGFSVGCPYNKEGEVYLHNGNYIITQLILALRLQVAERGTIKEYVDFIIGKISFGKNNFADDTEIYVTYGPDTAFEFDSLSAFFHHISFLNRTRDDLGMRRKHEHIYYNKYFKTTYGELKEAFKNK